MRRLLRAVSGTLMLFNDRDEEFPADCSILFEKHADAYPDMECIAMLGMMLAVWLTYDSCYKDGGGWL